MGEVVSFDPIERGNEWALELLQEHSDKGMMIMGFSFPRDGDKDNACSVISPDDIRLSDILMARAILDIMINDMMRAGREVKYGE